MAALEVVSKKVILNLFLSVLVPVWILLTPYFTFAQISDPIQLTPQLSIANPPKIEQALSSKPGESFFVITLPEFVYSGAAARSARRAIAAAAAGRSVEIIYQVTVKREGSKQVIKKRIKTNYLTLKNLKPGNYTVSYRVKAIRGERILARSKQSPSASFSVLGLSDSPP